jgi:hypothetical protein
MDFLKSKADAAKEAMSSSSLSKEFGDKIDVLKEKVDEAVEDKLAWVRKFEEEKRRFIQLFIQRKLEALFDHGMNIANGVAKEKLKDPYMPQFVKNMCDDMVDGVWPDVKMELKDEILKGFAREPPIAHGEKPGCCGAVLAFLRYNLLPYDRGVWRQLRNPLWWLFTLGACVPVYNVMIIMYVLQFLVIDKSDEFQLFQFIQNFKSLQFVTLGVIGAMVGSIQYYICVTRVPMTCVEASPRENFWTMLLFFVQVIFVFAAFLLMSCSHKKGGFYYQMEQSSKDKMEATAARAGRMSALTNIAKEEDEMDERTKLMYEMRFKSDKAMLDESKNRLLKFMIYDMVCFLLCIGLILWMAFYNMLDRDASVVESEDTITDRNWKFVMTLYWIKVLYGFLSFPFILLKLPLMSTLISHARPTGYNPYGNTVPFLGVEEQRPVPWDPERRTAPIEMTGAQML